MSIVLNDNNFLKPKTALLQSDLVRPDRNKSEDRDERLLWLDKNENMDLQYTTFLEKLLESLPKCALFGYPDCYQLYKKLACSLNVIIDELFLAAGSDGIIRAVYEAFIEPGDIVLYPEPTFAMYPVYAKTYGAQVVALNYQSSNHGPILTVDTLVSAIQKYRPRLVCLPNPNSPTGTVFADNELSHIIETAKEAGSVILIDEAYYPFYPKTALTWIHKYPNLVIARTFSKAWGLAGIRVGYAIANKELTNILHKSRPMYEVGALSIILAERVLEFEQAMLTSVKRLNEGKAYFLKEMEQLGFITFGGEGNFLHIAFGLAAEKIHRALEGKVLYRKSFAHPSLAGYSRFTATTQDQFILVVQLIKQAILK